MAATRTLHLGFNDDEMASSPYAAFYWPEMAPLAPAVCAALAIGAVAHELMPPFADAGLLHEPGYQRVETGYTRSPDGAGRVAVLTPMPGVSPALWDWWFGWHGGESQRYKLWHPRAHVAVAWADEASEPGQYVGRTSCVTEYIGATRIDLEIRFVTPASAGLDAARLAAAGEVAICARVSVARLPFETGWLIHHIRPVAGGSEMRSRFWTGGENLRPRHIKGSAGQWIGDFVGRRAARPTSDAADLLVHCAQEMSHLAALLPELHARFGATA